MPKKKTLAPAEPAPDKVAPVVKPDRDERETVIMFVDIMGASEVSNHKTLREYADFVNKFQEMFRRVCERYIENWFDEDDRDYIIHTERGDEGLLMIFRPEPAAISGDVDAALNIALELKREWICEQVNSDRIKSGGLLPINLAIGIHVGKTHLERSKDKWNPEGYAINLAKRVESYSRAGRFTNIYVSESAHGHLNTLPDERLYVFDGPQVFSPKGISRDITVYEVKHHYLPTDWKEMVEQTTSTRAKTLLDIEHINVDILRRCLRINPTNVWLVEEFIRSSMISERLENLKQNITDPDDEYAEALAEADRLAQSDHRDAGGLFILGLIEGERGDYHQERERYDDAINFADQLAEAHWYKALSYSFEVFDLVKKDLKITYDKLDDEARKLVDEGLKSFEKAKLRRSGSAWISFDYGCELIRWKRNDGELQRGIDLIALAVARLPEVADEIAGQPYLKSVLDHPQITPLLPKK
jgi:class 3 adenylate cyclase